MTSAQPSSDLVKEYHDDPENCPSPPSSPLASSSSSSGSTSEEEENVPKDADKPRYSKKIRNQVSFVKKMENKIVLAN